MRLLITALLGLSLAGCTPAPPTPSFVLHSAGASLVVRVAGDYGVQYLRPGAWEVARAVLKGPGGQEVTAEGEASRDPATGAHRAALSFAGLAPGEGYTLDLTLLRQDGDTLQPVGAARLEAVTLAAGSNALAIAPGQIRKSLPAPAPQAMRGFVSSLPGAGMIARLNAPAGVVAADDGTIYVADSQNGSIRRLKADAQGHLSMTHLAGIGLSGGYADGVGATAKLNRPNGMALAPDGTLYVADSGNARVRKIVSDPAGNVTVSTLRNATGGNMLFHGMTAVGVEPAGTLVVAMPSQLLRLTPAGQGYDTSVIAGDATAGLADGVGQAARFSGITDLAVAPDGAIYVADGANGRVRVVTPAGVVSSLPGSYPGVAALTVAGGRLYMAQATRFSSLDLTTGVSTDLAGGDWPGSIDGPGAAARFSQIAGIAVAPSGTIFIADAGDHRLRRAEPQPDGSLFVGTVAGDGEPGNTNGPAQGQPLLKRATAVAVDPLGGVLVADAQGHRVMRIAPGAFGDYDVEVLAGTGVSGASDGPGSAARFNGPAGLAIAPDGAIYVTDLGNNRLRKLVRGEDGTVTVSTVTSALEYPTGVAVTEDGRLFVTEAGFPSDHPFFAGIGRRRVVEVILDETGAATLTNLAGAERGFAEGPGADARFGRPTAIAPAPDGTIYVADAEDHRIRVLTPLPEGGYTVSTLAGDGVAGWTNGPVASARFNRPASLAIDPQGRLYVADYWNHRLQVIENGEVRTVTGGPNDDYVDGPAGVARFSKPVAVALGPDGAIYVADSYPHGVRKVSP